MATKLTEKEHSNGLNTCDKCGHKDQSEELIWITAEDFQTKPDEDLDPKAYDSYDALCLPCYLSELLPYKN